jgi:hypothetical protein
MKTLPSFAQIVLLLSLAALLLAACQPQTPAPVPQTGGLDTPRLVLRLRSAGAAVEEAGELEEGVFGKARLLRVNGEDLQVYEFASEAEQQAAAAAISANGYTIGTSSYFWISQPYFYAHDRLVVLYLGVDEAAIDLLAEALGRPLTGAAGVELRP